MAVGVTQYTFSPEHQERVLMSSAATCTAMNDVEWTIMLQNTYDCMQKSQGCMIIRDVHCLSHAQWGEHE